MSDTTIDSVVRVSGPINADGLEMSLETGRFANLADGAVTVRVGDTTVLSTVCPSPFDRARARHHPRPRERCSCVQA